MRLKQQRLTFNLLNRKESINLEGLATLAFISVFFLLLHHVLAFFPPRLSNSIQK